MVIGSVLRNWTANSTSHSCVAARASTGRIVASLIDTDMRRSGLFLRPPRGYAPPGPPSRGNGAHGGCPAPGRGVIPTALIGDRFRPLAAGDRGEAVGRRHEPVPGVAAGGDDGLVLRPDAMAELVLAQVLPHVLARVQLGRVGG